MGVFFDEDAQGFHFYPLGEDTWQPDSTCYDATVPYYLEVPVGHLSPGTHTVDATESVYSARVSSGDYAMRTFDVTCPPHGIVERSGPSDCLEGSHMITDPCSGETTLLESPAVDLDAYLCAHAVVDGPDIGTECPVIDPQTIQAFDPLCRIEVRALDVMSGPETWLQWARLPCTESYDAIRGNLANTRFGGGGVDLGPVVCLVNDSPAVSTLGSPGDVEAPPAGRAFFYLVRSKGVGVGGITPYSVSSSGQVATPSDGDCPAW